MTKMMNISIIGGGNVAWHLTQNFTLAGLNVFEVYGRDPNEADTFSNFTNTTYISDIKKMRSDADIYIIAVNDDVIEQVLDELPFKITSEQILAHTSGARPSKILAPYAIHYGCLWPLQTLTKELPIASSQLPIIFNGSDFVSEAHLGEIADQISDYVMLVDDKKKGKMHLAAVMLNNFVNHINRLVSDYCKVEGLDFSIFKPLIKETALKLDLGSPSEIQTGPAKRNDKLTIEKHLEMLENYDELYRFYCLATESIIKKYHKI